MSQIILPAVFNRQACQCPQRRDRVNPKTNAPVKEKHPAPTCGECHSAHYDPAGMSRVALGQRMISRCGRCHPEHTVSYLDNIHGKLGVNLANKASAFCTDCHGAHKVIAFEKQADALAVCQRCHPGAASEFTDFVIHASVTGSAAAESPKKNRLYGFSVSKLSPLPS